MSVRFTLGCAISGQATNDPKADIDSAADCAEVFTMRTLVNEKLGTVPLYRNNQLMRLGWKAFLPHSLLFVVLVSGYLMATRYGE